MIILKIRATILDFHSPNKILTRIYEKIVHVLPTNPAPIIPSVSSQPKGKCSIEQT
jgi:hypothetical protein